MSEQPNPTVGSDEVYPVAKDAFLDMLEGRTILGKERYGRELRTHNGRNPYQDAMEEMVDGWQYLIQARLEHDDLLEEVIALRAENKFLRKRLGE